MTENELAPIEERANASAPCAARDDVRLLIAEVRRLRENADPRAALQAIANLIGLWRQRTTYADCTGSTLTIMDAIARQLEAVLGPGAIPGDVEESSDAPLC